MVRTRVVAVLAVLASSCGGPEPAPAPGPQPPPHPEPQPEPPPAQPPGPPVPVPLNAAFNGRWEGDVSLAFPAYTLVYPGVIVIAVSGTTATVAGLCPGGSGTITSEGGGDSAQWHGSHTCPAANLGFNDCRAITLVHNHAAMTLDANRTVTAVATGVATGCGTTVPFTTTFVSR